MVECFQLKDTSVREAMLLQGFPGGSAVRNLPAVQEMLVCSLDRGGPLEKEMATHPRILAWEIPWTEEPGGPQFMGSQRVGRDLATEQQQHVISVTLPSPVPLPGKSQGRRSLVGWSPRGRRVGNFSLQRRSN